MFAKRKNLTAFNLQPLASGALAAVMLVCSGALIAEPDELPDVEEAIDDAHKNASELLNDFASQIDNYFADESSPSQANDTSATIRLDVADPGNGDFSIKGKLKLRLVLPHSQRRVRLLLDVDEDDNDDGTRSSQLIQNPEEDRSLALALRFIRKARAGASFNVDLGARRHQDQLQGFARLRTSFKTRNPDGWSSTFNNDYRQYFSSGYWNHLNFDFWQNIRENSSVVFRTSTSFKWENNEPGTTISQTAGLYRELKQGSLLAFEGLLSYNTSPAETEEYYEGHQLRLRYRKSAFRPWLYFEIWPSVYWANANDTDPKLGGLLRTEVSFGQVKK